MSRIGKLPISLPSGVAVTISSENVVTVKGPKGELQEKLNPGISISVEENKLTVSRANDSKQQKALHGLYRALINNMVTGVSAGYTLEQELVGVGYKASNQGQVLDLVLGYSHHYVIQLPEEVKVKTLSEKGDNPRIILESIDKQLIGQVAAKIRSLRAPEPYKGKGIKFKGEVLRKKAGKSAAKK